MKITARRLLLIVVMILLAIQVYRPARTNPPEDPSHNLRAVAQVTPEVDQIFARSCNDCHSYKTVWPWYAKVAPSSWLVASDVDDGRRHLNFSEWTTLTTERQQRRLSQICSEVDEGGMPLRQYTWMHEESPLDEKQRETVCQWTKEEQARITTRTGVAVPPPRKGGMQATPQKDEKK